MEGPFRQFYDAQIVAAAERAGADEIWSEDFNVRSGQGFTIEELSKPPRP